MLKNAVTVALTIFVLGAPLAGAQSAFNSTADTGEFGNSTETTNTQYPQADGAWADAQDTAKTPLVPPGQTMRTQSTQGRGGFKIPDLPKVVTAMPKPDGSMEAGGSLALKNQGLTKLQQTSTAILSDPAANAAAEPVVGDEGAYIKGYGKKNAINNLLSPGLTTGNKANVPPVSEGY